MSTLLLENAATGITAYLKNSGKLEVAQHPETADQPDLLGLRDRALIAIMVYSFAWIGAVIQMKVGDYFVQGRRRWIRLH